MPPGKRLGGRTKGTPNKLTQDILSRAEELGVDPFKIMLLFAGDKWKELGYDSSIYVKESRDGETTTIGYTIPPELRLHAAKEAAKYMYPQRKAIEHSGEMTVKPGIDIIDCSVSGKIIKIGKPNEN